MTSVEYKIDLTNYDAATICSMICQGLISLEEAETVRDMDPSIGKLIDVLRRASHPVCLGCGE